MGMYIAFMSRKLQNLCEDSRLAERKLGDRCGKLLLRRMAEIQASDNLAILKTVPGAHCHGLEGNRYGQYGLNLEYPKRLVILPKNGVDQGVVAENLVTEILVVEIVDYH